VGARVRRAGREEEGRGSVSEPNDPTTHEGHVRGGWAAGMLQMV